MGGGLFHLKKTRVVKKIVESARNEDTDSKVRSQYCLIALDCKCALFQFDAERYANA